VFNIKQDFLINEQIRFAEVQVIDEKGEKIGKMSTGKAVDMAYEKGLDLVLVSPNKDNPVCKMLNYSKYKFEMAKKAKEARKNQKIIEIKEIRLSPNVEINDLKTKANNARKFIEKGDKVKVTLRFRGREMAHISSNAHVLDDFAKMLEDIASVVKAPKLEGRNMTMFLEKKR
jgi:translation initiation factor IF-3